MDALLTPVFVLISLFVPVLLLALLLYAIPVRAAATVMLKDKRQEQVLVISWGIFGIRTSGSGEGRLTDVLIAGNAIFSHSGSIKPDGKAGEVTGIPETSTLSAVSPDISEIVHVVQKMIGPVGSFGSAFWRQSRFVEASGTVMLGLGDPVLTGEVCGMYWASRFVLLASHISVELEPVFDRAVLEMNMTVRIKVKHPLLVLLAGFRLAWHPAMREAISIAMRRSRGMATV
jgi:hypothetical protein